MPIIDVFIAMKMYRKGTDPKSGEEIDVPERMAAGKKSLIPEWGKLQSLAVQQGSRVNVYYEADGTCNKRNFLKSLQSRMRIVIFAGHGWTDSRYRANGSLETGGGIRINQGQALGTFGITQAKTDQLGRNYGEYSPIPIIKASRLFFFSCNPGGDFRSILRRHLSRGSIAYYTYAGTDSLVWVPSIESSAYVAAASMIFNQEAEAIQDANKVLANQKFFANGDKLEQILGTR
jgi:hypothetical protein